MRITREIDDPTHNDVMDRDIIIRKLSHAVQSTLLSIRHGDGKTITPAQKSSLYRVCEEAMDAIDGPIE